MTTDDLAARIRQLASQGLRVRDISSLLHVHPEIVRRVLEDKHA
jgi:orotate phosphoribosyltransferase-like protein